MMTAAAPSFRPEALPAVTVPSLANAGRRPVSDSRVEPGLMYSSLSKTTVPFLLAISSGRISSLNLPAFCAASAFSCDCSANSSCSARVTSYFLATFSAVMPMWYWLYTSHRPSTIMVSTILKSPMRKPSREPFIACGEALMFSWPPAMMMLASPHLIACAARCVAFRPLPHTLLMVNAGMELGKPALMTAWRAAFWPTAAVSTWPRIASPIRFGSMPVCASKPLITCAPSSDAGILARLPPNLPTAVRPAATITTSSIYFSDMQATRAKVKVLIQSNESGKTQQAVFHSSVAYATVPAPHRRRQRWRPALQWRRAAWRGG